MLALSVSAAVLAAAGWIIAIFNRLIRLRNEIRAAWGQIDVQLKRRYDLIPELMGAVKGYMEHEKALFSEVARLRAFTVQAAGMPERADAEERLGQGLQSLFAAMEAYPALKSSENVMQLQEELVTTENRIAFSRQFYNDLVANYMTLRGLFPHRLVADAFSFGPAAYFSVSRPDARTPDASLR